MKTKIITVADVIEFFKTIPPDTKIRVKKEVTIGWDTTTRFVEATQFCEAFNTFNGNVFDTIDGIEYSEKNKTVDFGI